MQTKETIQTKNLVPYWISRFLASLRFAVSFLARFKGDFEIADLQHQVRVREIV
jgi:hypothetical protein